MPKDKLLNILRDKVIELQPRDGSVTLIEKQNENQPGRLANVVIDGIPDKTLILQLEHATITVFNEKSDDAKKYRRKCDYVFITEFNNIGYVIYIEMKSSTRSKDYIQQMWGSRSLMEYLNFAIKNLDKLETAFDKYQHRYVKFGNIPFDKDTTCVDSLHDFKRNITKSECNDKPGSTYIYNANNGDTINLSNLIKENA